MQIDLLHLECVSPCIDDDSLPVDVPAQALTQMRARVSDCCVSASTPACPLASAFLLLRARARKLGGCVSARTRAHGRSGLCVCLRAQGVSTWLRVSTSACFHLHASARLCVRVSVVVYSERQCVCVVLSAFARRHAVVHLHERAR
eukprot:3804618-Pleurochrysis_carterae.AAC.1